MQPPQMMGYDRAITVFSPQGRLYQVEYAREAVKKGTISLGIVYADGVLLAADKNVSEKLMIPGSIEKIYRVDKHIGAATSGLVADGRRIVDKARVMAQSHRITYEESMAVDSLTKEICDYQQLHTQVAGVRPFGTSMLIGGVDGDARLFETDPSGSYWEYMAAAIGENSDKVRDYFTKHYRQDMARDQAIELALKGMQSADSSRFNEQNIELAYVEKGGKFDILSQDACRTYMSKLSGSKKKKE